MFWRGRFLCFHLHVKHAELLVSIVKNVRPLLAALSELRVLKIQNDLPESLNFLILLLALSMVLCSKTFCCRSSSRISIGNFPSSTLPALPFVPDWFNM